MTRAGFGSSTACAIAANTTIAKTAAADGHANDVIERLIMSSSGLESGQIPTGPGYLNPSPWRFTSSLIADLKESRIERLRPRRQPNRSRSNRPSILRFCRKCETRWLLENTLKREERRQ